MRVGKVQQAMVVLVVAGVGLAVSACGSTRFVTVTNTVVQQSTTTVTASAAADTETTPTTATTAATSTTAGPPAAPGKTPVLSGTYGLDQTTASSDYGRLPSNAHDGVENADARWTFMSGSCKGKKCVVVVRRLLSDSTIEDLRLFSSSPSGVYTGTIPGGDGSADCGNNTTAQVRLSMIVRAGGLQSVSGQTVASRLAGHIFADYQCPGSSPTHDVATYVGTRS